MVPGSSLAAAGAARELARPLERAHGNREAAAVNFTPMAMLLGERVEELRSDRTHGGSWMARRAVEALADLAEEEAASTEELLDRLVAAGRELAGSRPGVGAVAGAVGRLLAAAHGQEHLPPDELRRLFQEEARGLVASRDRAAASIAIQLRERLSDAFVLTHSASATVREALLHTPPEQVVCTVSAPYEEGRAFSEDLRAAGLQVELVEDEEAAGALAGVSLLLVGADTVFRDGAVCNKIGTCRLAEAAADEGVPTIVACEVIKLAPIDSADAPELREEKELFDVTPPELIEHVVTEEGTVRSDDVRPLVDRTPFLSEGYSLLRGGL
jgi:translation initiation factor 2B subunit (eIF-2B alpha/beta/delta family)